MGILLGHHHFRTLPNARGSLLELDTHLELAFRINYLNKEIYQDLRNKLDEVGRIVNGLIRSIEIKN